MKIQKANKIITFDKRDQHRDAQSTTLAIVNQRNTGKRINVRKPTFDYGRREDFSPPEYNLMEIGVIEDVESYVRQSFQKKTALMFKEGEEFTGKNKQTIDYIKKRIQQIEHVSGISWRQLLRETGYALLSRSNYFWVKVRNYKASGGRIIGGVQPVAAYFGMGAENIEVRKNKSGKIVKYRQMMPDGRVREFTPRDIVHFHAYRKPGFSFGTPQIVPVKEDIRALRRIEENVELLIYQTLFPIFQYKVGTENKPAGDIRLSDGTVMSEVEFVRGQIAEMPAEGGIVTPERHEIGFIGAEGKSLKVREYLDYFKQRVLSGLGISGVDIGEGATANRATADNMSRTMVDSVKDYQDIIEDVIEKQMIKELLLESTFAFDILAPENSVDFKFKEIDIEEQMKKNTNAQVLYNGNIIDINEARRVGGHEPIALDQEEKMYSKRVTIQELLVQIQGQLDVAGLNSEIQAKKATEQPSSANNAAANSNSPTNQYGTKTGPQKSRLDFFKTKDGHVASLTRMLKSDISKHVRSEIIDRNWINTLIALGKDATEKKYIAIVKKEFVNGLKDSGSTNLEKLITSDFQVVKDTTSYFINKYTKDINGKVQNIIDKMTWDGATRKEIQSAVEEVFDKIKYRGDFIDATERMRAYNYGKALGLQDQGFAKAAIIKNPDCEKCKEAPDEISLLDLDIISVPPFHPNSNATIGKLKE